MEPILLSVAGFNIGIKFKKTDQPNLKKLFRQQIQNFYKNFIVFQKSQIIDYWIEVIQRKNFEVYVQIEHGKDELKKRNYVIFYEEVEYKKIVTFYHLSMLQFQLVLREVCQKLLVENQGLIFHASASLVEGSAWIFLGPSGAGKSTAMTILSSKYKALADDTIIIRKEGINSFYFYQTPFQEKNAWFDKSPKRYNLGKIFILKKSKYNKIEKKVNKEKLIQIIVKQFFTKQEHLNTQMKNLLKFIADFDEFYFLYFNLNNSSQVIKLVKNNV